MPREKELLTDAHIEIAIPLFAIGKSRIDVAQHLLDTDQDLYNQAHEHNQPKAFRRRLAHALRIADPTSTQFSEKYKAEMTLHQDAIQEALQHRYDAATKQYLEFLDEQIYDSREELDDLTDMLNKAETPAIQTHSDHAAISGRKEKLSAHIAKLHHTRREVLKIGSTERT